MISNDCTPEFSTPERVAFAIATAFVNPGITPDRQKVLAEDRFVQAYLAGISPQNPPSAILPSRIKNDFRLKIKATGKEAAYINRLALEKYFERGGETIRLPNELQQVMRQLQTPPAAPPPPLSMAASLPEVLKSPPPPPPASLVSSQSAPTQFLEDVPAPGSTPSQDKVERDDPPSEPPSEAKTPPASPRVRSAPPPPCPSLSLGESSLQSSASSVSISPEPTPVIEEKKAVAFPQAPQVSPPAPDSIPSQDKVERDEPPSDGESSLQSSASSVAISPESTPIIEEKKARPLPQVSRARQVTWIALTVFSSLAFATSLALNMVLVLGVEIAWLAAPIALLGGPISAIVIASCVALSSCATVIAASLSLNQPTSFVEAKSFVNRGAWETARVFSSLSLMACLTLNGVLALGIEMPGLLHIVSILGGPISAMFFASLLAVISVATLVQANFKLRSPDADRKG